ncbi:hypothetical protein [Natrarchaeobaculum aegyptiacum]|nr:hypothetical protein [Natrarchaeobaculum aegyptiacum]
MVTFVEFTTAVPAIPFDALFSAAPRATIELERDAALCDRHP